MKVEKLQELQEDINAQRLLRLEDCAALLGEVWRLKTGLSAKDLEVSYWRGCHEQVKAELERMAEANQLLRSENEQLIAVHGLPNCYLENRWSNCAVRMRKQRQLNNNANDVDKSHTVLRNLAGTVFKSSSKRTPI
jgi:DNA repair exonuclease SbcCD ATPase subunit